MTAHSTEQEVQLRAMEEKYNTERSEKEQLQEKTEELETEIRGLVFYFILSSPVISLENHIL